MSIYSFIQNIVNTRVRILDEESVVIYDGPVERAATCLILKNYSLLHAELRDGYLLISST